MKKILLLSAVLLGTTVALRADVSVHIGIPLPPLPRIVIGHPAPRVIVPDYRVVPRPVCAPAPVVVVPPRVVCAPPFAIMRPHRVVYAPHRPHYSHRHDRGHHHRH